jgi:hypothetical protein
LPVFIHGLRFSWSSFYGIPIAVEGEGHEQETLLSIRASLPHHSYIRRGAAGGKSSADRNSEQPTKFELVINLKTAKQIGVTILQSVLYRADRVIKYLPSSAGLN